MADDTVQMPHAKVNTEKMSTAQIKKATAEPTTPKPKSDASKAQPKAAAKASPKRSGGAHRYYKPVLNKATSAKANRIILLSIGGAAGVILLARVSGTPGVKGLNDPGDLLKIALGSSVTIIALMALAEADTDLAIMFAILILLGALLTYGAEFAGAVVKGTLSPGKPSSGSAIGRSLKKPTSTES